MKHPIGLKLNWVGLLRIAATRRRQTMQRIGPGANYPSAACHRRPKRTELTPDRPSGIHQDAFARFRETIFWARSMKARKLAAMWRRPG